MNLNIDREYVFVKLLTYDLAGRWAGFLPAATGALTSTHELLE